MAVNSFWAKISDAKLRLHTCISVLICGIFAAMLLAGCSGDQNQSSSDSVASSSMQTVRIGTMPTEDILPVWVAEEEGLFSENGVAVEVISFDSAQALSAAISASEVDLAMTDVMRAVKLCESGVPLEFEWITLGADPSQGRFGVMASADAPYSTLQELAEFAASPDAAPDFGVAVAANTVPEYVFDSLCEENGIAIGEIPTVEVASLPERYALMANGNVGAAALPGSLLALGQSQGMKLLADDTQGDNISQSVMVARQSFAEEHPDEIIAVAASWDRAVDMIANDVDAYLALLVANANINESIAQDYPISTYPYALTNGALRRPEAVLVIPQIEWMIKKGYGSDGVSYDEETGKITSA